MWDRSGRDSVQACGVMSGDDGSGNEKVSAGRGISWSQVGLWVAAAVACVAAAGVGVGFGYLVFLFMQPRFNPWNLYVGYFCIGVTLVSVVWGALPTRKGK